MTKQEYVEKKKNFQEALSTLDKVYLSGLDFHEGDIVIENKTGEEVQIATVRLGCDGDVGVENIYRKRKDGLFSEKYTYNINGVIVNGRVVHVFNWQ